MDSIIYEEISWCKPPFLGTSTSVPFDTNVIIVQAFFHIVLYLVIRVIFKVIVVVYISEMDKRIDSLTLLGWNILTLSFNLLLFVNQWTSWTILCLYDFWWGTIKLCWSSSRDPVWNSLRRVPFVIWQRRVRRSLHKSVLRLLFGMMLILQNNEQTGNRGFR